MNILFNFDLQDYAKNLKKIKRDSARGIIVFSNRNEPPFNPEDKIALVYAKNSGYYKFPGGGINSGEDNIQALIREVSEEIGMTVKPESIKEFGVVPRLQKSEITEAVFEQKSFYYFCKTEDSIHQQKLDDYELEEGFKLKITSFQDAIKKNLSFNSNNTFDLTMVARDTNVLQILCGKKMEPSRAFAQLLLNQGAEKNPGPWKQHSYEVANCAEKIASKILTNGGTINPDSAYIYGLLHDIGRRNGTTFIAHVLDGYEFLNQLGYEKAAQISITHSFNCQDLEDYVGKIDVTENEKNKIHQLLLNAKFDDYDRLIQLLDATCFSDGTKNLELRMKDVKQRYGSYPQKKWDKNFELKNYFEKLMNQDFYEVLNG